MRRRDFIKTTGLGAATLTFPGLLSSCAKSGQRPNILFIMSDDHAEQAISCYGSQLINTPNIDRIANEGVLFKNSFVTNSICAPSRATLLTGKYSHKNGLRDNRDEFDGSQVTFPKLLQKNGYQTSIVGKWHLKTDPTGFDTWKILNGQGEYYNPLIIENGVEKQITGYTTDIIGDLSIDVLKDFDSDKPFCLLVHNKAPHRHWWPSPKYFDAFKDKDLPLPETFYDDYATRTETAGSADMRIDDMFISADMKLFKDAYGEETGSGGRKGFGPEMEKIWKKRYERLTPEQKKAWDAHYDELNKEFKEAKLSGKKLTEWKYQQYIKDYLRCILSVDENAGRLLDHLDESGLAENTIVVYTSDQGFYLGEHGWYDKRFMYEESLGMPLVMRYPERIEAGKVSTEMVMNLDFAPTFLDFAGVQAPEEMQGESFRSLVVNNNTTEWRNGIYYHYYEYPHGWHDVKRHYGIRTERYKLIHFYYDVDVWELYDLQTDPNELNNIYDDPKYSDIVRKLKSELKKLQAKYEDDVDIPAREER